MKVEIVSLIAFSCLGLVAGQVSTAQILKLKHRVKTASDDLQSYRTRFEDSVSDTTPALKRMTVDETARINQAVNQVDDLIKDDIATAQKEGKNIEPCYESTKPQLDGTSRKAFAEFHECLRQVLAEFNDLQRNIESHKLRERSLLNRIDSAYSCMESPRTRQMQVCDAEGMRSVRQSVDAYEDVGEKLKTAGHQLLLSGRGWLLRCLQKKLDDLQEKVDKIRKLAVECIKTA